MPKISKSCYTSYCYVNYIKNHLQVNAMQNKTSKKKKRILKTILTVFSRKEKAITRYTRIYIKTKWQG